MTKIEKEIASVKCTEYVDSKMQELEKTMFKSSGLELLRHAQRMFGTTLNTKSGVEYNPKSKKSIQRALRLVAAAKFEADFNDTIDKVDALDNAPKEAEEAPLIAPCNNITEFKVGSLVMVDRKITLEENNAWGNIWISEMDKAVGKVGKVVILVEDGVVLEVEGPPLNLTYPLYVCSQVEAPSEEEIAETLTSPEFDESSKSEEELKHEELLDGRSEGELPSEADNSYVKLLDVKPVMCMVTHVDNDCPAVGPWTKTMLTLVGQEVEVLEVEDFTNQNISTRVKSSTGTEWWIPTSCLMLVEEVIEPFPVGASVMIKRKPTDKELFNWENKWLGVMDTLIGKVGIVQSSDHRDKGVMVRVDDTTLMYPDCVLDLFEADGEAPLALPIRTVTVPEEGKAQKITMKLDENDDAPEDDGMTISLSYTNKADLVDQIGIMTGLRLYRNRFTTHSKLRGRAVEALNLRGFTVNSITRK